MNLKLNNELNGFGLRFIRRLQEGLDNNKLFGVSWALSYSSNVNTENTENDVPGFKGIIWFITQNEIKDNVFQESTGTYLGSGGVRNAYKSLLWEKFLEFNFERGYKKPVVYFHDYRFFIKDFPELEYCNENLLDNFEHDQILYALQGKVLEIPRHNFHWFTKD